jgi:acetyl esterase/lipase
MALTADGDGDGADDRATRRIRASTTATASQPGPGDGPAAECGCRPGRSMVGCALMMALSESETVYENAGGDHLPMLVFGPADGTQPVAGLVLFHGGALRSGSAGELAAHCRQLASRGIFAVSAGYRLLGQGAARIDDCISDVRRAVEHYRTLAAARGLDSSCLASGGSSAGAHLALVAALIAADGPRPAAEPRVAAVVAFNPVVDLLAYPPERRQQLERAAGIPAGRSAEYSPIGFVRPGNPPMLIHHGTHDEVAPVGQVRRFRDAMVQAGNDCRLLEYERAGHAFHYPGAAGHFADVTEATAAFLLDRLAAG